MNKLLILIFLLTIVTIGCTSAGVADQANNSNAAAETNAVPASGQGAAVSAAAATAPDALVAELYKQHDAHKSPFFQSKNRALVDKYFTKATADLIWKDATTSNGEVGALDGDPLYNAQDTDIKNFKVGAADIKGDKAAVIVTFDNFKQKQTLKFSLAQEKGAWKIDDIDYGEAGTLVKWLKEEYSGKADAPAGDGRFEGKYQVGPTTCAVSPTKMAFEVKWEKGSGSEIYIYDDRSGDRVVYRSESSKKGAEPNMFSFDDETLDTGTFYRADGKEFPVTRVK